MNSKSLDEQSKICSGLIEQAQNICILTGAGISTNAGIPDFRGPQGLYVTKRYDPDKVFDSLHFHTDPKPFFEFAKDFIELETKIKPTKAHHFFADLEKKGKLKSIITQNIDSLHQLAGSKNVIELHGSFWRSYCLQCEKVYDFETMKELILNNDVAQCACGGIIKPDIVFFGEDVKNLEQACHDAHDADLFMIVGTSCVVYPAASVPSYNNGKIIAINMDQSHLNFENIVLRITNDIDEVCEKLFDLLK